MASSTSSSVPGLLALEQAFRAYLEATNLYPGLTTINCVARGQRLLMVACHPSPEIDDPRALLQELENAFLEIMPAVGLPDASWSTAESLPVRIALQLKSSSQPYATHTFAWRVEDAASTVFPPESPEPRVNDSEVTGSEVTGSEVNGSIGSGATVNGATVNGATVNGATTETGSDPALHEIDLATTTGEMAFQSTATANGSQPLEPDNEPTATPGNAPDPGPTLADGHPEGTEPFSDRAIALPDATIEPPADWTWLKGSWAWLSNQIYTYWIYGLAGMIILGSGLFAYALSRPCVVGGCERLEDAEAFYSDAQLQLGVEPDGETLKTARGDLQAAIELLTPIPRWSSYYQTAATDLQQYQTDLTALNRLLHAKDKALEAATLSQNPPHSVDHWVDVQMLWQQSIDLLEAIPPDSPAADYGQQKLAEYRNNHKAIGRRIVAEEEAEANFSTAIQTGQLAQQRMDTAESLAGWQLAAKEWQAAIKGLSVIPQGTSAYSEAQTYLQDYRQRLARASAQANLEENSTRFYQQAVQAAREAQAYEAKNQWTLAVSQWKRAVASVQQISPESTLGAEATVLIETYQPALTNAQSRLRTAVALQQLTQTVGTVCQGSATPCQVVEDPSQIQVTLSSQYAAPLRQAITPPAADGTFAFTNELSLPVQQLIDEIMTISHQVNRQVAIYDSQGSFVARYRPDLGGFIKN